MALNLKRIALCDDDPADRDKMLRLIQDYLDKRELSIRIDLYPDGESFLSSDLSQYDLVVLDIFMGELTGVETARRLRREHPHLQIIFCSSSNSYASESYEVSALQYLTKPVQPERLCATLDRFLLAQRSLRTLTFRVNRMEEQIYVDRLLWIETRDHKCILHTLDGDFETRTPFAELFAQLKDADFIKPIRYALVSLAAVAAIPSDVLTLKNGDTIPVSRDQRQNVRNAFSAYRLKSMLNRGGALF